MRATRFSADIFDPNNNKTNKLSSEIQQTNNQALIWTATQEYFLQTRIKAESEVDHCYALLYQGKINQEKLDKWK